MDQSNKTENTYTARQLALKDAIHGLIRIIPLVVLIQLFLIYTWFADLTGDRSSEHGIWYLMGYIYAMLASAVIWITLYIDGKDIRKHEKFLYQTQVSFAWMLPIWSTVLSLFDAILKSHTFNVQFHVICCVLVLSVCFIERKKWIVIQTLTGIGMIVAIHIMPMEDHFTFLSEFLAYLVVSVFGGGMLLQSKWNSYVHRTDLTNVLEQVEYDELTGLYTRQAFFHHGKELLEKYPEKNYDLLLSDIEDFKLINQQYGEEAGNDILRISGNFLSIANSEKSVAGRYGSDQFVVLMEHNPEMFNASSLEKYLAALEKKQPLPDIVTKFGIYDNVDHDQPVSILCDRAMMALRRVKHQYGILYAHYDESMQLAEDRKLVIEHDMENAYEREEFKVYYQPKHDTFTGQLVGAEALIRWEHPGLGMLSPSEFIPIFEENGFISKADQYVWERTCRNQKKWREMGIHIVPISTNSSRRDFDAPNCLEMLEKELKKNGLTPDLMDIEITETIFINKTESFAQQLAVFHEHGFNIELDDFGTGFSSLNMLGLLPLSTIKFDMSFMRSAHDPRREKVMESCIQLAKNLGIKTLAEGVETVDQIAMLKKMGCDTIQGYYYSRPIPEEEFEEYLKKNQPQ